MIEAAINLHFKVPPALLALLALLDHKALLVLLALMELQVQ